MNIFYINSKCNKNTIHYEYYNIQASIAFIRQCPFVCYRFGIGANVYPLILFNPIKQHSTLNRRNYFLAFTIISYQLAGIVNRKDSVPWEPAWFYTLIGLGIVDTFLFVWWMILNVPVLMAQRSQNRMAWQWAETLVEIRGILADIRGTTKLGCRWNFPKHEFNRPVCLEAHHYLLAHLSQ